MHILEAVLMAVLLGVMDELVADLEVADMVAVHLDLVVEVVLAEYTQKNLIQIEQIIRQKDNQVNDYQMLVIIYLTQK